MSIEVAALGGREWAYHRTRAIPEHISAANFLSILLNLDIVLQDLLGSPVSWVDVLVVVVIVERLLHGENVLTSKIASQLSRRGS